MLHQHLLAWIFWTDSDRLNFSMTMDYYSPCPEREIWPFLKGSHIFETGGVTPTKTWCACTWHQPLVAWIFWADSDRLNFSTFIDHKLILSSKLERPRPPKLVCMHSTSIPTTINFLSQFRLIKFFNDHGLYSPCPKREIWLFLKGSHISETEGFTPTKTGVHARDIDP